MKVKHFGRILVYTISMYLVTHLIVFFYLFPIGTVRILINPKNSYPIRKSITGLLFTIIGKRLKVLGLENIDPEKKYVIVSNYPGLLRRFCPNERVPRCFNIGTFISFASTDSRIPSKIYRSDIRSAEGIWKNQASDR